MTLSLKREDLRMDSVSAKGDVYINTLSLKRALGTLKEQFFEEREREKS